MTRDAALATVAMLATFLAGVGVGAILNGIAYTHHIRTHTTRLHDAAATRRDATT